MNIEIIWELPVILKIQRPTGQWFVTLSLLSPTQYLTLKRPTQTKTSNDDHSDGHTNNNKNNGKGKSSRSSVYCDTYSDIVKIVVEPGSLLILRSDASYLYWHGIGKFKWVHLPPTSEEDKTNNNSPVDPDLFSAPTSSSLLVPAADVDENVLEEKWEY